MFLQAETLVCDLIDKEKACWKTEIMDALFLLHDVEKTKKIPLSSHLPTDKQIWACSPNGLFTVCSAYWVAREMSRPRNFSFGSDEGTNRLFWTKIWKIQVPHKIRHFTWKACHDLLPTKCNLMQRKVLQMISVRSTMQHRKTQATCFRRVSRLVSRGKAPSM